MKKTPADGKIFWALAALAAGAAAWLVFGQRAYLVQNFEFYADRGELLFHAVRAKAVSYSMPLLSLLVSAARFHLGLEPGLFAKAAALLLALPAYAIGARGGGRARGALFALAALAAGLGGAVEAEQAVYSLAVLVFLSVELRRQAEGGARLAVASGLAAGLTLLVRSPLFAFPLLAAGFQYFSLRPGLKRWLGATALFLACSLVLLVPWVRLNHSLFGRVILFEEERSTCNIITGASGIIYTIEGDARAYAGLSRTESPYPWAMKKILSDPANYAGAVAKRLWQTFLLLWPLVLAAAGGFWLWRAREARFLAFFCGYFALVHCLLSIEARYFYPLKFPLALLAAGGVWELLKKRLPADAGAWRDRLTLPLLAALLLPAALALGVVWRYPAAARPPLLAVEEALKKYPADPWLHKKKAETLFSFDLAAQGREELRRACALGGGGDVCCLSAELDAGAPAACGARESRYELLLVKTWRELEEKDSAGAAAAFAETRAHWLQERNGIKALPYKSEQAHLEKIIAANKTLWDTDLYGALLYWPPEQRAGLVAGLARLTEPSPKLRALALAGKAALSGAEKRELSELERQHGAALQASEFEWERSLRELALELLRGGNNGAAGGPLGLLLALAQTPEQTLETFGTGRPAGSAELRAAALAYLAGPEDAAAAKRLAETDAGNFAYSLILLKAENFSPAALAAAEDRLARSPYPLAAGAAAYAARGQKQEALALAAEAARLGRLGEAGWQRVLLAAQLAGDYRAGLAYAQKALRAHPGSPELLNARGMLKKFSGDAAGAKADFEAGALGGRSFSALMNFAAELEAAGEKARAADFYGRAAAAAPEEPARQAALLGAARAAK